MRVPSFCTFSGPRQNVRNRNWRRISGCTASPFSSRENFDILQTHNKITIENLFTEPRECFRSSTSLESLRIKKECVRLKIRSIRHERESSKVDRDVFKLKIQWLVVNVMYTTIIATKRADSVSFSI